MDPVYKYIYNWLCLRASVISLISTKERDVWMCSHLYFNILCASFFFLLIQLLWTIICIGPWRSETHNEGSEQPFEPPCLTLTMLILFFPSLSSRGYMYAGLEFGAECYCGHKIQAPNASESECSMECKGEKSNQCGGANRLSIYRLELSQESARRCESDTLQQQKYSPELHRKLLHTGLMCNHKRAPSCFIFESLLQSKN